ncbi:MAG: alpha/beta fold hydrolase [Solirubrobacteraceae bacterium]
MAAPTDIWLEVRGLRLHALDWGAPSSDRPPTLLLHGAGLDAHIWDWICAGLSESGRCIALDLRGHGSSDWAQGGSYTLDEFAQDTFAAADALEFDRFGLVGMSMGGLVALTLATQHASRLAWLALLDVTPFLDDSRGPTIRAGIDRALARAVGDGRRPRFDPAPHTDTARRARIQRARALTAELDAVTCPTLVLRGERSEMVSDADATRLTAGVPDGCMVTIAGAGHILARDAPAAVLSELSAFLAF